eukprot:10101021-Lingulodinium_polyedra.AAC.1
MARSMAASSGICGTPASQLQPNGLRGARSWRARTKPAPPACTTYPRTTRANANLRTRVLPT